MPSRRSDRQYRPVVVLVGMMGAGKTSVGRELAGRSEFIDLDKLIEQQTKRTIREIFEAEGETAFRKLELQALRDATTSGQYKVVSTGGGVVTTSEARQLLREMDAFIVWLTASNEELTRRATKSGNRPLLDHDPGAKIEELMNQRAPMYAEVADLTLNTQGLSVKQVAQLIEEALKHHVADRKTAP